VRNSGGVPFDGKIRGRWDDRQKIILSSSGEDGGKANLPIEVPFIDHLTGPEKILKKRRGRRVMLEELISFFLLSYGRSKEVLIKGAHALSLWDGFSASLGRSRRGRRNAYSGQEENGMARGKNVYADRQASR